MESLTNLARRLHQHAARYHTHCAQILTQGLVLCNVQGAGADGMER